MIKRVGLRAWWLVGLLCVACTGGHGTSALAPTATESTRQIASVAQGAHRLISINAGGAAVGNFVADTDFVNGTTSSVRGSNVVIDTSATNAAPEAVYATYRESAGSFRYVYKNAFVPGQPAFVRLHFAEVLGLHAGQRQFDVTVNDAPALTNFDIFAAAGDNDNKAVVVDVPFTPDASGSVTITFSPGAAGYPIVAGLEIYGITAAPGTLTPPTDVLINSGGPATGNFSSDAFVNGLSETGTDTAAIDVSGPNTAPAAVYATYRTEPKTVAYLVTGLAPNAPFYGFLHFEEPVYAAAGKRVMTISVAGIQDVVPSFDIYAAAGNKMHRAVALPIAVAADDNGEIPITITGLNGAPAIISGFELHEGAGPPPSPSPTPTPSPLPTATPYILGTFTQFALPSSQQGSEIAAGPDGALWITAFPGEVVRMTTAGATTTYSLYTNSLLTGASGITVGPDNALWFMEYNGRRVGRLTTGGAFTESGVVAEDIGYNAITVGSDGALWFTLGGQGAIGRLSTSGAFTSYPTGLPLSEPIGIAAGPDGAIWFTDIGSRAIGRITTSGALTETTVAGCPDGITTGPDENIWFTDVCYSHVGRLVPGTNAVTEYLVSGPNAPPSDIISGPEGALWFTEDGYPTGGIGEITTGGVITQFTAPTGARPEYLAIGSDGAIWFTEYQGTNIGRLH